MLKYAIVAVPLLLACAPFKADIKMPAGICYYEGGDFGGTPSILKCVQAAGNEGFLHCQGSEINGQWRWYSCGDSEKWTWLDHPTQAECPTPCPTLEKR